MSWHKVLLDSPEPGLQLMELAKRVDEAAGHPTGFALFSGFEFDDEQTRVAYYFSPVAASLCLPHLSQFQPIQCAKPEASKQLGSDFGVGLAYGPANAFDLLK